MGLKRLKKGFRAQIGMLFACYNEFMGINPHGFQKYAIEVMLQLL